MYLELLIVTSLVIWLILLSAWGKFWRCDQRLEDFGEKLSVLPGVCAIIPARNEAAVIETSLKSLLNQQYSGSLKIILVDDQSEDETAVLARALNQPQRLAVITGQPLPSGWTGKLWAMQQGINYAETNYPEIAYYLFTDADIEHGPENLRQLVDKAETEKISLVSLMVKLRCESFWEKLLVPAFVFFFQKLYPFAWVNDPRRSTAAAAGGCILIERQTLQEIGGIKILRDALIDDCTLAQAVKSPHRKIWLGLTESTLSLRPYDSLTTLWDMVARTAYTQLNYSLWLLIGTAIAMGIIYLVPPVSIIIGLIQGNQTILILGLLTWLLMCVAYIPTLRLYNCSPWRSLSLPYIAFLYTLMTIDSAWRHWRGLGGAWKGRTYS
ncbi:glycosyltransferase [Gloeocapsa sp. PCC 73106]|uniref:glycosyltransferase n=1 Tax=Gloeocapsa sp. PCC 73106 TaxID=102232 RepID=UPI0002ABC061|nr:glycosyltransferase [Gloeocapsa sp. PCC 73106]ELR98684.1 hopene-associated glycosyltransferase HpnB [Gloeocapsa sp. PCC 73106]